VSLLLLSLTHKQAATIGEGLRDGRIKPEEMVAELWQDHIGQETDCFLCGAAVVLPCYTQIIPDRKPGTTMAVPLCGDCAKLSYMQRSHRCLRLTRKMWRRK
jgi:hypothetical protein